MDLDWLLEKLDELEVKQSESRALAREIMRRATEEMADQRTMRPPPKDTPPPPVRAKPPPLPRITKKPSGGYSVPGRETVKAPPEEED